MGQCKFNCERWAAIDGMCEAHYRRQVRGVFGAELAKPIGPYRRKPDPLKIRRETLDEVVTIIRFECERYKLPEAMFLAELFEKLT